MSDTADTTMLDTVDTAAEAEELTPAELAAECEARAATYALLSRLYNLEVDEKYLNALKEMLYPVESGNELMNEGHYHIAKYLSNSWVEPLTDLSVDYGRTFLGSGIDTYAAAYPFESVYTSERRLLMADARDEVLAIYRANGLDKSDKWTVGEDHISVELEFMRILCLRAARALSEGDMDRAFRLFKTQQGFLEQHICIWTPVFTADIRRFSNTSFYQGIAELTDGFLQTETDLLASLVGDNSEDADAEAEA
ncbi:chaperone protein TorD [Slackia heliotrinireducens]|uniref:Uncharacterized component of anaerobic dehydrogenase n=1 Tax=Slackia heliotrinireducens (strain ATCC 29202 / DSM 20476 / NCTC 11029 / RHS 1) TaxID=471855 RepID=C7N726_SLAHD|nr:molecular chaperone TorD family protein [Slackia heliotrinireducens]ACV22711.1 uncharacterized component of anaerobic dehydrogenase [Slackia heliotrinireducens DSM 20476]VEH01328.1 chaperone protein TorD [Slackia heliotrinireducens]